MGRPAWRPVLAAGALALVAAGCGSSGGSDAASPSTTAKATTTAAGAGASAAKPCGRDAAPPKTYDHVVVMLEENRTWTGGRTPEVGMGFSGGDMPFLAGLAEQCAYYEDWTETNGDQNSLNQYIGLTSGVLNDATVNDCEPSDTCQSTDDNIFRQVREAGGTARSYVDGATEPCSAGSNKAKHIPALYYRGGDDASHCDEEVLPWSELDPDHLPTFAFLTPDQCHDGHDCPNGDVDAFAKETLTKILDGADYRKGKTLVVVVYDEDQPVPNLLIAPTAKAGAISSVVGSHAGLLKTFEQALGLPVMDQGQLPDATSLRPSANV
ncbi:MAG: alkaline phosphatase family protein [Acidimicrobiales bacterium]